MPSILDLPATSPDLRAAQRLANIEQRLGLLEINRGRTPEGYICNLALAGTNAPIPSAIVTPVSLVVTDDPKGLWQSATAAQLHLPIVGYWLITANAQWASGSATGSRGVAIEVSGTVVGWEMHAIGASDAPRNCVTRIVHTTSTADYARMNAYQTSGANLALSTAETQLSAALLYADPV